MTTSGYTFCACAGCFDETVSSDVNEPELCELCAEAGCSADGDDDCHRDDACLDDPDGLHHVGCGC